jgi:hypothetical protein
VRKTEAGDSNIVKTIEEIIGERNGRGEALNGNP